MGAGELVRLVLGFSILLLLFHHFFAGRYVYSAFGIDRRYDVVLTAYFWFVPFWGWRQVTVLLVAWTHGCLGVHYWLRARSNYHSFAPILLTVATLLPVLALLGLWQRWSYARSGNRRCELESRSTALLDLYRATRARLCRMGGEVAGRTPPRADQNCVSWRSRGSSSGGLRRTRCQPPRRHSTRCHLRRARSLHDLPRSRAARGRQVAAA